MASQGPNSPSSASTNTSVGTLTWISPTNIYSSNDFYAIAAPGTGTVITHYLTATGFGFSIPSGATIDGIESAIECKASSGGGSSGALSTTKLIKAGSIVGTDQDSNQNITSASDITVTVGGPSNLWGTTWTDTEINASDFGIGVSISTFSPKGGGGAFVDHITLTIYYTASGGGSAQTALLVAGD